MKGGDVNHFIGTVRFYDVEGGGKKILGIRKGSRDIVSVYRKDRAVKGLTVAGEGGNILAFGGALKKGSMPAKTLEGGRIGDLQAVKGSLMS